jgi:hypothetical protein
MLQLLQDGTHRTVTLGNDLSKKQEPQIIVRGHTWMGCKLADGGQWALMGTTMAPGFDQADYEQGYRDQLIALHPEASELITQYTRD